MSSLPPPCASWRQAGMLAAKACCAHEAAPTTHRTGAAPCMMCSSTRGVCRPSCRSPLQLLHWLRSLTACAKNAVVSTAAAAAVRHCKRGVCRARQPRVAALHPPRPDSPPARARQHPAASSCLPCLCEAHTMHTRGECVFLALAVPGWCVWHPPCLMCSQLRSTCASLRKSCSDGASANATVATATSCMRAGNACARRCGGARALDRMQARALAHLGRDLHRAGESRHVQLERQPLLGDVGAPPVRTRPHRTHARARLPAARDSCWHGGTRHLPLCDEQRFSSHVQPEDAGCAILRTTSGSCVSAVRQLQCCCACATCHPHLLHPRCCICGCEHVKGRARARPQPKAALQVHHLRHAPAAAAAAAAAAFMLAGRHHGGHRGQPPGTLVNARRWGVPAWRRGCGLRRAADVARNAAGPSSSCECRTSVWQRAQQRCFQSVTRPPRFLSKIELI